MKSGVISILCMMFATCGVLGQHLYQQPKPLIKKSDLDPIIGTIPTQEPSRELNIVWVYGYDEHHIAGAHDYVKVKNLMVGLLSETSKVNVEEAFGFPTEEQLRKADLLVMYLHLPQLKKKQFKALRGFVENGGGLIALHESMIMRPRSKGKRLARCFGFAWKEGASKWGAIFDKINIDNQHPIFKGFSQKITIADEFYWDMFQEDGSKILGSVRTGPDGDSSGPVPTNQLTEKESPVFWVNEIGEGKVFGTTTGHHTFTYYDPKFRIVLFRAMAWVVNEHPNRFTALVFSGITNNGMVGIMEDLRGWNGKIRR
tara:strand:- start:12054 stop:12995 length:942 start_codon:yes stop_codon:yes gene_type:complete